MARLLVLLFCSPLFLVGQDSITHKKNNDYYRWSVNLSAGPGFPLGDYSSREEDNPRAGFSMVGLSTKLRVGYQVSEKLFLISDLVWFYNPIDANNLLNSYTNANPSSVYDNYKLTSSAWKSYGLLLGVGKSFVFNDVSIELMGMVGFLQGKYGTIKIKQTDYDADTTNVITYSGKNALEIALSVGFSFKTHITKKIGVCLGGDFVASEMDFNSLKVETSNGISSNNGKYTQPLSVFQLSAGFFITF